jgi:hypothetical protein
MASLQSNLADLPIVCIPWHHQDSWSDFVRFNGLISREPAAALWAREKKQKHAHASQADHSLHSTPPDETVTPLFISIYWLG